MDPVEYEASLFKALYHLRWGIEENYKRLKQWVEIENFSGKSALSVKQDFYAKIIASNLTSLMISFKGTHFPKDVILYAVFFYVRYGVSYRDLEEIMDHRRFCIADSGRQLKT
jgi:hypothetical protein